jgi:membrane-associated phospholipid phosphatase
MPFAESLFAQPAWTYIPGSFAFWGLFTRLGEAQILLPAMLVSTLWLVASAHATRLALAWWAGTVAGALLTTATKVAFIGWEVGYAPLDYAGISGHAMFSAAIVPVLLRAAVGMARAPVPRLAIAAGYLLAFLIAVSRVKIGAHSVVESTLGFALGCLTSGLALRACPVPRVRAPMWLPALLGVWMLALPLLALPSLTHSWVTRLSLKLSGRPLPYTKNEMRRVYKLDKLKRLQQQQPASADAGLGRAIVHLDGEFAVEDGLFARAHLVHHRLGHLGFERAQWRE